MDSSTVTEANQVTLEDFRIRSTGPKEWKNVLIRNDISMNHLDILPLCEKFTTLYINRLSFFVHSKKSESAT